MFTPGRFVSAEENCEIFPSCLPTVSVKCQYSSQRTGKRHLLKLHSEYADYFKAFYTMYYIKQMVIVLYFLLYYPVH